ncbi:hypothetical protein [Mucilaginibacter sp. FT3.2]|uniref:hypothetical protein n=1 Tax=Mucilaginibacter sp. FT3.2 TaxID=2723090 RepID=UPI00160DC28A|nr:hypothetical protein [Mucilaginibacter sp. FT3.2]MBB6229978.1 hypothetical protein [Mucilaginibacter sp. FT3.2]
MMVEYKKAKSLIFDGAEQEIFNRSFDLSQQTALNVAVKLDDFASNNFEDLQKLLGKDDFEFIVKTGEFSPDGGFLNLYKNSDNLRLYFYKKNNTIVVFAYGEFQPGRYMLYLEGFWVQKI